MSDEYRWCVEFGQSTRITKQVLCIHRYVQYSRNHRHATSIEFITSIPAVPRARRQRPLFSTTAGRFPGPVPELGMIGPHACRLVGNKPRLFFSSSLVVRLAGRRILSLYTIETVFGVASTGANKKYIIMLYVILPSLYFWGWPYLIPHRATSPGAKEHAHNGPC